jgi:ATPase family associated with various cellular activities (AAA)
MAETTQGRTVTIAQARKMVTRCMAKQRPIFIWGPAGIGKSELAQQVADDMGGLLIDLRMPLLEPTDLRGMPYYNKEKNVMDWAPPIDLPSEELAAQYPVVVLFLDEMNSAAPAVQASGYQLILNRKIGRYTLPKNVVIIAAGNRESDKGVTYRMPAPLANRFVHLEMRPDFACWLEWAVKHNVHQDVVGYLTWAKRDLFEFDAKSSSRAFPTPRSWKFVSDLLADEGESHETLTDLVIGTVGEGVGLKFEAHRKISALLPNPEDILSGKEKELSIKEISAMYALTIALCYELKEALARENGKPTDKWHAMADNFFTYMMKNFETEMTVMGARVALTTYALPFSTQKLKSFEEFHKRFGKYVVAASTSK